MTWTPNEPTLCATMNLAALFAVAAVVDRRRIAIERFGEAIDSEIALPGDADYPLSAAAFDAARLVRKTTTAPTGLIDERDHLPAAWAFPSGEAGRARFGAMLGGQPAPGRRDDNPVVATIAIAMKAADTGAPDFAMRFHNRVADLLRRIEREHGSLGVDDLAVAFDEPVPAYDPSAKTVFVVSAAAVAHPGERTYEPHDVDAITIWNDDGALDSASAAIEGTTLTLSWHDAPNPVSESMIELDGLSIAQAAQAIAAVGAGWRAAVADGRVANFPARLLLEQERTGLIGAGAAQPLTLPPLI